MPAHAKVLVVEDDLANQQTLCALLRLMGCTTTVADGGKDALRLLDTPIELDIILSDVVMPGMSGIDFARLARLVRPGVPIVLVASGSVALLKPYTAETLERVLNETLANGSRQT